MERENKTLEEISEEFNAYRQQKQAKLTTKQKFPYKHPEITQGLIPDIYRPPPPIILPDEQILLLTEIRDLLKVLINNAQK